jgi:hypothetical protein
MPELSMVQFVYPTISSDRVILLGKKGREKEGKREEEKGRGKDEKRGGRH